MTTLLNIFEQKKILAAQLMELEKAAQEQKITALTEIKKIISENCITYKELLSILNELKVIQSSERELLVHNAKKYHDPINNRSWDGVYYVPNWILENVEKLDDWLVTDENGRNHTKMALKLLGRDECSATPVIAERTTDNNWIKQTGEQFNTLFANNHFSILKDKFKMMNETNQQAILSYLKPEIKKYLT